MADFDDENRHAAMVEFLGCFPNISVEPNHLSDLGDGVVMFEAMSEISPEHFDSTTIARNLGTNWALKSSNLRKLIRNIETYFHDVLGKEADFEELGASVSSIARNSDKDAIASIVELIVAAAVTCEERGKFVTWIMNMSAANQIHMKGIIETSMANLEDFEAPDGSDEDEMEESEIEFDEYDGDAPHLSEEMSGLFRNAMANLDAAAMGMDGTVASEYSGESKEIVRDIMKDRDDLRTTLQDTRRELAACKSQSSILAEDNESAQKRLRALAEDLQDRLGKRQEELSTVEADLTKAKRGLEDAEAKVSDLEEKNAALADELDVANAKAAQLRKAEATVAAYRKKLEGVGVLSQQMTDLEDQSASYLKQIMDLEMETKKVPELQKSVDELQRKLSKSDKDKLEAMEALNAKNAEVSKLKADLSAAESAKKMFEEELTELRSQTDGGLDIDVGPSVSGFSLTSVKSVSEAKEKATRLEIENKKLKEQLELQKSNSSVSSTAGTTADIEAYQNEISQLKKELKKKEAEKKKIGSDKERLEAYTKKTLSKFQEKYLVALQECKAKLKEKHDKIEALEMRSASEKNAQKREEKLLSSTVYELGLTLMQQRLKEQR